MDVAIAIDRFETSTTERVRSIAHRWAGLRTFAPDRTPVVGYDAAAPGFFWLAGQGGYGIQTAPAMAALAASLILNEPVPEEILIQGVNPGALDANRPSLQPAADTGGMQTLLLTH
jgi:D-arginine dehydrogenase